MAMRAHSAVGAPIATGPGPYVAGVALFLASAGLSFFRLLALPRDEGGAA